MKNILIGGIFVLVLGVAAYYFFAEKSGNENEDGNVEEPQPEGTFSIGNETWTRQSDAEAGIQFAYRSEPNGHVLEVQENELGSVKTFVMMLKEDAADLASSTAPRETPPSITVSVFSNEDNLSPGQWAAEHPERSNIDLALTEVGASSIAGRAAIRYQSTGLYTYDTIVAAHGGLMYVISGGFLDEASQIRRDFEPFLRTIAFIGNEGQE